MLAEAARCMHEGLILVDRSPSENGLELSFANPHFACIVGYEASEIDGAALDLFHTDTGHLRELCAWAENLSPGASFSGEGDLVRKDGRSIVASWTFSPVCSQDEPITHLVGTYRDITDKRRLEEALVHAQRLDAIGRMAGGIAHDFNNLISVISGFSELIAQKVGDSPNLLHDVGEIQKAGQKAAALTRKLLALGRRQPMIARLFDLNSLVRESNDLLSRVLGDAGRLEFQLHGEPLAVRADPDQIQQVLINLVLNARDALREKGRVVISTNVKSFRRSSSSEIPEGDYAVLTLTDNGAGMDQDTLSHIFEPFFTTKGPGKGSGLGLAQVYGVIQQSGGRIRVKSTVLVGSSFEILLPIPTDAKLIGTQAQGHSPVTTRGSESILLLEGDSIVERMLSGMLASDGYKVTQASSLESAFGFARQPQGRFDLLIAAIGSAPECNQLVQQLRLNNPRLRVLCTHTCQGPCGGSPEHSICQTMLPKPFAMSELLQAVRRSLDR